MNKILSPYLFPEYNVKNLSLKKDKFIITQRILEHGSIYQVRQIIKLYKKNWIKYFLKKYGERKLSLLNLNFWLTIFNIRNRRKIIKKKLNNKLWEY